MELSLSIGFSLISGHFTFKEKKETLATGKITSLPFGDLRAK